MRASAIVLIVFLCYHGTRASSESDSSEEQTSTVTPIVLPKPVVIYLHVNTDIRYRYAITSITSRVSNPANVSQEVSFNAILPDSAFISGFQMLVDDEVFTAYVKKKEEAESLYTEAVSQGRAAAHVVLSARDSKRFSVSVNVEPQKKINFKLTYEELLSRSLGSYKYAVNLDPGQLVQDLKVTVRIKESSNITNLVVPTLRTSNDILEQEESNPLAIIEQRSPQSAEVKYWPTKEQQKELARDGIQGQLIVQYDVDRTSQPGEILVGDGYFAHFFIPEDLPPLPKHVIFVLDMSGSMRGRRGDQLQEAMDTILDDLQEGDYFSIVVFSTTVQVWDYNATDLELRSRIQRLGLTRWADYGGEEELLLTAPTVIAPATSENINKSKDFLSDLYPIGATNINEALKVALKVSALGRDILHNHSVSQETNDLHQTPIPEPIIIFLTDGKANINPKEPNAILSNVKKANRANSTIFSIALGDEADFNFLKKLSLRNTGFARKIYEASDTALQLRDFYRQVASPLLANVTFRYQPEQIVKNTLTNKKFRRVYFGSELVVAGKLQRNTVNGEVNGKSSSGNTTSYTFTPATVTSEEGATNTTGFMERLWAYLTIQKLLDKQEAADAETVVSDSPEEEEEQNNGGGYYYDDDDELTIDDDNETVKLALRYSFVTPLTSLVVVKPNSTSRAHTEDAFIPSDQGHSGTGSSRRTPSSGPGVYDSSAGSSRRATTPRPSAHTPAPPTQLALSDLTDVTWLTNITSDHTITLPVGVNGTSLMLNLASVNQTNTAYSTCTTPGGEAGHCRHLEYCVLNVFVHDETRFLPYFCQIESFVGVCCPESLQPAQT